MSDLQIVLIIIGGLIIVAVLVFNWWQERRFHQQVENNFSTIKSDALLEEPLLAGNEPFAAKDDFDDSDFSINHDLIKETSIAQTEARAEPRVEPRLEPEIEIADQFDGQALYTQSTYSEPEAAQVSVISEDIMPDEQLPDYAFEPVDNPEVKPVNHDGIKAIFQDAFNKNLSSVSPQEVNANIVQSQDDEAKSQAASAQNLPAKLHAQVDLIAVLHLADESTVEGCAKALKSDFEAYDKPVFVYVQTPDLRWLLLSDISAKPEFFGQKISKVSCSLQLADRAGPVQRSVVNRFQLAVESLGLDINAHVEWLSTGDPVADAVALDAFCIDVDKTMGFHLLHGENGAFTGTKLRGLAEAQGLELAADGTFKYYDETTKKQATAASNPAAPSFVMFNREQYPFSPDMLRSSVVKGITFQLDIPHVSNCTEAYNHMVQVAKQMEIGLHAQLVDDNNRPLGDVQIDKIRHQLKIIQATMLTRNIIPGSDVAHRLFS